MTNTIKYKALIVDDERSSRNILRSFIDTYQSDLKVIGEATNIIEAKKLIKSDKPHIVFLDIEMPHGNAFDLLDQFKQLPFHVIFITAYSQYALQALKLTSVQYLLKPLDIEDLEQAIEQTISKIKEDEQWNNTQILLQNIKGSRISKIVIPLINGFEIVPTEEVLYIEADDNFSIIHRIEKKSLMACRKLKFYEENLKDQGFYRIHRSTIVNLEFVTKYTKGKTATLTLTSGKELDIAQSRKKGFINHFI